MLEKEYSELLNFLLDRLKEMNALEVSNEIRQLISNGKVEEMDDNSELKRLKIKKGDVGTTRTLPLTSKEAFETAINYIQHVVIDIPYYGQKIMETFRDNVIWRSDKGELFDEIYEQQEFKVNSLQFESNDKNKANIEFDKISNYILQ